VVGLGEVGDLTPGELQRTLQQALLRYVTDDMAEAQSGESEISAILVGAGFGGVAIRESAAALLRAACSANAHLARVNSPRRIARLSVFEDVFDRAASALHYCEELVEDPRLRGVFEVNPQLMLGKGRYRRATFESLTSWWRRVRVTCEKGQLRFNVLTERARNEEYAEPTNLDLIHGLIRQATATTYDDLGLSHALFELLVPNRIKSAAPDERGLVLSLDKVAATYPWELMREANNAVPLVVTIGLIRQLSTVAFRQGVMSVREPSALVIGEPISNFAPLPAAREESEQVALALRQASYDVLALIQPNASRVLMSLFERRYRVMHFAGHGVVDYTQSGSTAEAVKRSGMVIGPDAILTAGEILKLRNVPELVFINCCHLGSLHNDASTLERRAELASGLATAFIEMGVRAVVAAGWAIDDRAAHTFSATFYECMVKGRTFGDAIQRARAETYAAHPASNTWGAYQAYGDPEFALNDPESMDDLGGAHRSEEEVVAQVEMIAARASVARGPDQLVLRQKLEILEGGLSSQSLRSGALSAALARAYGEFNDFARAIPLYERALSCESGQASWRDAEQLANLKVRHGIKVVNTTIEDKDHQEDTRDAGVLLIEQGISSIEALLKLGETAERHALRGSAYKRLVSAILQGFTPPGQRVEDAVHQALLEAYDSYLHAAELARSRSGYVDHYPLLNALDCALLLHLRGVPVRPTMPTFTMTAASLEEALLEAKSDGLRRMAQELEVFHATAVAGTMFTRSLYATTQPGESALQVAIDQPQVRKAIVAEYRHQYRRFGSEREWGSVASQGKWVLSLLPLQQSDLSGDHADMGATIERLRAGLGGLIAELDQALLDAN
jgi:tetratricopeptide (TPR) repeat protein